MITEIFHNLPQAIDKGVEIVGTLKISKTSNENSEDLKSTEFKRGLKNIISFIQ